MISFPDIDPVAISLGPVDIRWYALSYLAGILLGWRYALGLADLDQKRPSRQDTDDFLPWAVFGVILGGRVGYVLFYQFGYFIDNPLDIFKVWHGGMSFHGGALGVILAIILYSLKRGINMFRMADIVVCAVPIGLFFGRIANFVNGELFGRTASPDLPWAVVFPGGGDVPRHPSQLYEALLEGAVLFLILAVLARRDKIRNIPGFLSGVFLAGYGVFRFAVEYFREPDAHLGFVLGGLSMGQILCIPMIMVGIGLAIWQMRHQKQL